MKKLLHNWILNAAFTTVMLFSATCWSQAYYNLQWPSNGSIMETGTHDVFAQAWEPGVTESAGPGTGLEAWIGVSPKGQNTHPNTWTMWIPAIFNTQAGNNDEFTAAIGPNLAPGTYYYASRFRLNGGSYVYGGYNSGAWNGTTNVSGELLVSGNPACQTVWYADTDGDGFGGDNTIVGCNQPEGYVSNTNDCNDNNPNVFNNADLFVDNDGDGYTDGMDADVCYGAELPAGYTQSTLGDDCDDNDASVWETKTLFVDNDGDGYYGGTADVCVGNTIPTGYSVGTNGMDCNDNNPAVFNNADVYADVDGDNYTDGPMADVCYGDVLPAGLSTTSLGNDCNDNDATVWEFKALYVDNDGDGYYGGVEDVCVGDTIPEGYSVGTNGMDCNDADPAVFNNADVYADADGDHYTDGPMADVCYGDVLPDGLSTYSLGNDCDDNDATKWRIDDMYIDADGDEYHGGLVNNVCYGDVAPQGYSLSTLGEDCDDTNAAINPGASEITGNEIDENCNGNDDDGVGEFLTQLKASQCGATLDRIYNALVAVANTPNVTEYYFEVTNTDTNHKQNINLDVNYFQLTDLESYEYETTYSVRVGLDVDGVWQGYGPACLVTTPSLTSGPSAIVIPQCGTTLAQRYSPIFITGPGFISSSEVSVTNLSTMETATIIRTEPWFSIKMLPSLYEYGTDYSIQVRVATTEGYSEYSAPCMVSTPAAPNGKNANPILSIKAVAYPNPFVDGFTVNMSTATESPVQIKVYDMVGKILESHDVKSYNLNAYAFGNNLPTGVYNVVVSQDGVVNSLRVVKK